jgi:ribose transport system substrate-binding protein
MNRFRWILVSSTVSVWLLLAACGGSYHAPEEKYFLVATNIKLPYWQAAAAGGRAAALQLGVRYDFVGPDTYDPKAQPAEFRRVLAQKPSGILVSAADPELMRPEIDRAIEQGVPVITIDADAPASKRLFFIGTNNYQAGMTGARVVAARLKGKGAVVIYTLPGQANLIERLNGYREVFSAYPGIKIAEIIDIRGLPSVAFDKTKELIAPGRTIPNAFVCLEAMSCEEVAEVLSRNQIEGRVIVAMDTDQGTLEWIEKGLIAATIAQKPYTMAYVGLKMLDDLHHHKLPSLDGRWGRDPFSPIPTFVDTGATLVDRESLSGFLQAQQSATGQKGR